MRPASTRSILARGLLAGPTLAAAAAYGPLAAGWLLPGLLGPEGRLSFSFAGRDLAVVLNGPRLRWAGYERSETTVMRGLAAMNRPAAAGREMDLARRAIAADLRLLGPAEGDPFARPGFILHRTRLGLPFACVEATAANIWRESASTVEAPVGGVRFESRPGRPARGVWLLPFGVLPLGLAGNLAFWSLIAAGPGLLRRAIRARRRRRGRCESCGYDRTGARAGPCPECGNVTAAGPRAA